MTALGILVAVCVMFCLLTCTSLADASNGGTVFVSTGQVAHLHEFYLEARGPVAVSLSSVVAGFDDDTRRWPPAFDVAIVVAPVAYVPSSAYSQTSSSKCFHAGISTRDFPLVSVRYLSPWELTSGADVVATFEVNHQSQAMVVLVSNCMPGSRLTLSSAIQTHLTPQYDASQSVLYFTLATVLLFFFVVLMRRLCRSTELFPAVLVPAAVFFHALGTALHGLGYAARMRSKPADVLFWLADAPSALIFFMAVTSFSAFIWTLRHGLTKTCLTLAYCLFVSLLLSGSSFSSTVPSDPTSIVFTPQGNAYSLVLLLSSGLCCVALGLVLGTVDPAPLPTGLSALTHVMVLLSLYSVYFFAVRVVFSYILLNGSGPGLWVVGLSRDLALFLCLVGAAEALEPLKRHTVQK